VIMQVYIGISINVKLPFKHRGFKTGKYLGDSQH